MSYTIQLLNEEGILLGRWNEDFSFQDEIRVYNDEMYSLLESLTAPVYFVHEFANPGLSMQDIMKGASIATREEKSTFQHPMIKQIIFVTTSKVMKVAAKGLNTMSFGNIEVAVFDTVDEALAFVRTQAA